MSVSWSPRLGLALAGLLAALATVAAVGPAAFSPSDTIICNFIHPDCLSNHWLLVWVAEQVTSGGSILHNDRYYWPVGDAPWLAGNGSEGFLYAPWHLLFGWPLASNVHLCLILLLNGLAAYSLARACRASPEAALAAAPTSTLLLYAVHELGAGRFSQVSFCWLAFFLALWIRLLDAPDDQAAPRRAVGAGVMLSAAALFYWYYAFFGVLAGAVLLAVRLWHHRSVPWRALAIFVATTLALTGPLLWVFLDNWRSIPGTAEEVFPHPECDGDSTWPAIPFLVQGGRHAGRALPLSTCIFAMVALWRVRCERDWMARGLLAVVVLFAGLMAGSLPAFGPYEAVYGLAAPLRRFWWPYRHVVVLNLALTTLAAMGVQRLLNAGWGAASGRRRALVLAGLALSVPLQLELQGAPWHAQFTRAEVPHSFYAGLAELPGDVLVEPPLAPKVASDQAHLIYQFSHKKKLLRGHAMWVSRVRPAEWDRRVAANSILAEMQRLEMAELTDGVFDFEAQDLQELIDEGATIWVLNREYFPVVMKGQLAAYDLIFTTLFGPPLRSTGAAKVWDARKWSGETSVTFSPFAWPTSLFRNGPDLPIQSPRPQGPVFSVPRPKPAEGEEEGGKKPGNGAGGPDAPGGAGGADAPEGPEGR